jgi:hypothetical protein
MSAMNPFTLDLNKRIQTGNVNSMLTRLFIEALKAMEVDVLMYEHRIDQYITNAGLPKNQKELSSVRGNIKKELSKPSMSWKVFLKSMVFLGVKSFTLSVTYKNHISETVDKMNQDYMFDPYTTNMKLFGGMDKDKDDMEDSNILHSLYQQIYSSFIESGLSEQTMAEIYVKKAMINTDIKDISTVKGGVKKEISRGNMTWRVFIKGLCYLGIEQYVLTVELVRFDRKVFRIGFPVSMTAGDIFTQETNDV